MPETTPRIDARDVVEGHRLDTLEAAILAICTVDKDRASVENGVGWNKLDGDFMHDLAESIRRWDRLTERQWDASYKVVRKYRGQLLRLFGIDFDAIVRPDFAARAVKPKADGPKVVTDVGTIRVAPDWATITIGKTPRFQEALMAIKGFSTRKWVKDLKAWSVPVEVSTIPRIREIATEFGFKVEGGEHLDKVFAQATENLEASSAQDAELDIEGIDPELSLAPFQRAGVRYILANNGTGKGTILADEMGLGKTVQALAAAEARDCFPLLVVVPAVVLLNWAKESLTWLPQRTVTILNGGTERAVRLSQGSRAGQYLLVPVNNLDAEIIVVSYDGAHKWKDDLIRLKLAGLVVDEAHYVKTKTARRTKTVQEIAEASAGSLRLLALLTGTPLPNRPVELIELLRLAGRLDIFGGEWPFKRRYCFDPEKSGPWGNDYNGGNPDLLPELNERIRAGGAYCRREKQEVYTELPPKRRVIVPVEMKDREGYVKIEADLREFFKEALERDHAFLDAMEAATAELDEPARSKRREEMRRAYVSQRDARAQAAKALVLIEATKQAAVDRKMDAVKAWLTDFLATGKKIVVFAHHAHIIAALCEAFDAPHITGSDSSTKRQEAVDRFQTDPGCQMIVCNIQAGGVGITLTAASDVCFIELPWRPGDIDQAEDRVWGRINDLHGADSWFLLADRTVEEKIATLIDSKRAVVEAATIGKVVTDVGIMDALRDALLTDEE